MTFKPGDGKGKKMPEAQRLAIIAAKSRPEVKERARISHLGNTNRRGKKASEQTRQRISEGHQGLVMSEAQKQLLKEIMNSEEVNARISEGVKRAYADPEMKERQRQGTMKAMSDPEYSQKMSESIRKVQATEAYKANHLAAMNRPEVKEALSTRALERWSRMSEEERKAYVDRVAAIQLMTTSRLELQVKALLDSLGVAYEQQYRIGWYPVDFYVASENLVIEVNGCYWHACPICGFTNEAKQQSDAKREAYIRKKGYNVIVIWEHEMKSDLASVLNSLLEGDA